MSTDFFAKKADSYEQERGRVANVENIANAILTSIVFDENMHIMDFGSGTGLLLEKIAPSVDKISAVDISPSMNRQLELKRGRLGCQLNILEIDLEKQDINTKFDGIISSMTMHHIKDIKKMFSKFYSILNPGGFIAIADLDLEDGSFHTEDTGIYHYGFDRTAIKNIAEYVNFIEVRVASASVVHKPYGDYPIFLLTAIKDR